MSFREGKGEMPQRGGVCCISNETIKYFRVECHSLRIIHSKLKLIIARAIVHMIMDFCMISLVRMREK